MSKKPTEADIVHVCERDSAETRFFFLMIMKINGAHISRKMSSSGGPNSTASQSSTWSCKSSMFRQSPSACTASLFNLLFIVTDG